MQSVKEKVLKAGLKINYIANKFGVNPNTMYKYMDNKREMPKALKNKIVKYLKKIR